MPTDTDTAEAAERVETAESTTHDGDSAASTVAAETLSEAGKADLVRFRNEARTAKAELDKLRKSAMSDQEKAIEAAKASARSELLAEVGAERVENAVRAAIAGRAVDADAILDVMDPAKFLNEDGRPDVAKISEWVDRIAPKPSANKPKDLGQGARPGTTTATQVDAAEFRAMSPEEKVQAKAEGRLVSLGISPPKK
jgi:hypothetical protein